MRKLLLPAGLLGLAVGCTPGVVVSRSGGSHDKGIRYYRPKPYLFIQPAGKQTTKYDDKGNPEATVAEPSDKTVSINLSYLPDFSEEYSIKVRSGLGIANVSLKLENGWNLTEINQQLDSQFDENVQAIAKLVESVGGVAAGPAGGKRLANGAVAPATQEMRVVANNVPFGYYESILGTGPDGRKRLYGWRYVGFAPFNGCPVEGQGAETACCGEGTLDLYGLVFEQGVMTFKRLTSISREGAVVTPAGPAAAK